MTFFYDFQCNMLPFMHAFENTSKASHANDIQSRDVSNKQRPWQHVCHGYQFKHNFPEFTMGVLNGGICQVFVVE